MAGRVHLRRTAGRMGLHRGPWIRARDVARTSGPLSPDDVAEVLDHKARHVAWGLYSEASSIAVRVLSWGAAPAEHWLAARIAAAAEGRRALGLPRAETDGVRLVNSEGDGLPGLVVDDYGEDRVVQITTAPMLARRPAILAALTEVRPAARTHVVVPEAAASREGIPAETSVDGEPGELRFVEHGLRFSVDAPPAQKTGAYFDQRANRRIVAELASTIDAPLLDVGCHVGGFALHARARGVPAIGVDSSRRALARAEANAKAAGLSDVAFIEADMFGALDDPALAGPFGTVVFDPPKIAVRKSDVDRAVSAMARTVGRLGPRVRIGGHLVLCTCSHHLGREHLDKVMLEARLGGASEGRWTAITTLGADVDHPIALGHREGAYLVVVVYQRRA